MEKHGAGTRKLCCRTETVLALKNRKLVKEILSRRCQWVGAEVVPKGVEKTHCTHKHYNKYQDKKMCCKKLHTIVNGKEKVSAPYDCKWSGDALCKDLPDWLEDLDFISADKLKERAIAQCKDSNKFVYYSCVFDSALGIHKGRSEYHKLVNNERVAQAAHKLDCYSVGDPHLKSFFGATYNIYNKEGKRVLYENDDIKITTTVSFSHHWGLQGVNSGVEVKINGKEARFNVKQLEFSNLKNQWSRHGNSYRYVTSELEIKIDCNQNHINVFLAGKKKDVDGCEGDCCTVKKNLDDIHPDNVVFRSQCVRKWVALQNCKKASETLHANQRAGWVKSCVQRQANEY